MGGRGGEGGAKGYQKQPAGEVSNDIRKPVRSLMAFEVPKGM